MERVENKSMPLISIITPTYNSENYIADTIESVLAQTLDDWEMIIVDDCSTDNTTSVIRSYVEKDERVKLIQLEKNSGAAIARNTAISHSVGKYIAFLDGDDQWLPEKLEKQLQYMQEKGASFSFTKYKTMDQKGEETGTIVDAPETVNYHQLLKHNVIGCLTVMLDVEKVGQVKMVDIRSRQDYVLWLELCKKGFEAHGIQEVLAKYRVSQHSLSSNKVKMAKQNWKVYREIEDLSLLKSLWYFINYAFYKLSKSLFNKIL
ncbi:glycosyltransferase family 2 protein [Evansella cellulosilytica]|nr:glycosyltransferase family 2 protein [Evansella cellulosilytica]